MLFTEILEELRSQSQTEVTAESFHAPQVWDGNVISTQTLGDLVELGPRTGAVHSQKTPFGDPAQSRTRRRGTAWRFSSSSPSIYPH